MRDLHYLFAAFHLVQLIALLGGTKTEKNLKREIKIEKDRDNEREKVERERKREGGEGEEGGDGKGGEGKGGEREGGEEEEGREREKVVREKVVREKVMLISAWSLHGAMVPQPTTLAPNEPKSRSWTSRCAIREAQSR